MLIKRGKTVKLRSDLITKLDDVKNPQESYSLAIEKLLDIAFLVDARMPSLRDMK